jgi:hypothetical protein
MEKRIAPLFTWRSAINSEAGPKSPTTRYLLLSLSLHMTEKGESCFPTIVQLIEETGLSRQTVISHLRLARQEGWITVSRVGLAGQRWAHNEYRPEVPEKAVHLLDRLAQRRSTSCTKAVYEVDPSTSVVLQDTLSPERARAEDGSGWAVADFREHFDDVDLTAYQLDLIGQKVSDREAWRLALEYWHGSAYRGASVPKLLDCYAEFVQALADNRILAAGDSGRQGRGGVVVDLSGDGLPARVPGQALRGVPVRVPPDAARGRGSARGGAPVRPGGAKRSGELSIAEFLARNGYDQRVGHVADDRSLGAC